ncbi:MAG: DUF5777 family beta-barrel protein [Cyclobacteriaceae bacterium]
MNRIKISFIIFLLSFSAFSQDELLELLEGDSPDNKDYASATFKSTRLINGHSVEVRSKRVLEFIISHRFGTINSGYKQFWGLDNSSIRLALEYGLTDNLNIGLGRASFNKVIDAFLKYRFARQSDSFPVTISGFGSFARKTIEQMGLEGKDRNYYTGQILIARKFSPNFSLQVMPVVIQRNLVPTRRDANLLFALGLGGRYKLSNRLAINAEYYPQFTEFSNTFQNSFAVGVDIETGGHVFQLHLTNAEQMNEQGFIGGTTDDFFDGDIHYGFNISRVFDLKPKRSGD